MIEKVSTAFANWLSSTTCKRHSHKIVFVSPCNRFAIFKHNGHSEYVGGRSGSVYCPTSYSLFDVENLNALIQTGTGAIWRKTGRWKPCWQSEVTKAIREAMKNERSKV